MVQIECDYEQIKTIVLANLDDKFEIAAIRFISKTQLDINKLSFLKNGRVIKMNDIIENIMSPNERQANKMKVLVVSTSNTIINDNNNNKEEEANQQNNQLNEIICPICKEPCYIEIKNYKIKLFGCKNGHTTNNIKLSEFMDYQYIDLSKIICGQCKKQNKEKTFNNEFYKCNGCNINLCPLCKSIHDENHNIINYDSRNNMICQKHKKEINNYCDYCSKYICSSCEEECIKNNHLTYFWFPKTLEYKRSKMNELRKKLNKFNKNIKEIIKKINIISENMEILYNIYNNILHFAEKNKVRNIYQEKNFDIDLGIYDDLQNIIFSNNFEDNININSLLYLYNEMEDKNISVDMNYILKNNNNIINGVGMGSGMKNKIRIFGETFVKNNKGRCKIIYEIYNTMHLDLSKEYELTEFFDEILRFYDYSTPISFKLKGINNIIDMSEMFSGCDLFQTLPDISEWDTSNVNNMSGLFKNCTSLIQLPDISKWDTSNVNNMSGLFGNCNSLIQLPDISKWDTSNVNNMSGLFGCCTSLTSIPDISKWDTSNVNNMSGLFGCCTSLTSIPDISKWDTSNVINMSFFFNVCKSLQSLPDISKWNTSKVSNMQRFFNQCHSLSFLPDISKWNTQKAENMKEMFFQCNAKNIPSKYK